VNSTLGRIQLGRFQLGQIPTPSPSGTFTATASPTAGPVYGSGLFTGTCGAPTLRVRGSGGTPLSKFAAVLGTLQLGRFQLGRPQDDAALVVQRSRYFVATAAPVLSVDGEGGPNVGAFTATSNPQLSVTGRLGKGFIATASPTAGPFFSGGVFVATASPTASAFLRISPSAIATGDPQLSFFIRAGQPGSCIAAQNSPTPDRPPNSAL
jgi:hypothetical protein